MKIALNKCFGGFQLSHKAVKRYLELQGKECFFYKQEVRTDNFKVTYKKITQDKAKGELFLSYFTKDLGDVVTQGKADDDFIFYSYFDYDKRTDPLLIQVIEELGNEASGKLGKIEIVEVPNDLDWEITDYDGIETLHEKHRSW